jgi:AcrR family transcriptional regulator
MAGQPGTSPNRLERRKASTRAALVRAAQSFLACGKDNVPILEITQAADVGMGSFYNHFDSKEELFQAAVEDALDAFGAALDQLTEGLEDPAQVFAQSFRLTGRLHRRQPELSNVLLHSGLALADSDKGLAPRARRDIENGVRAGRFTVHDPDLAMVIVAGASLCLGKLLHDHPDRDDAAAADQVTEDLLRMLGVPANEAHDICRRPLPAPDDHPLRDTAIERPGSAGPVQTLPPVLRSEGWLGSAVEWRREGRVGDVAGDLLGVGVFVGPVSRPRFRGRPQPFSDGVHPVAPGQPATHRKIPSRPRPHAATQTATERTSPAHTAAGTRDPGHRADPTPASRTATTRCQAPAAVKLATHTTSDYLQSRRTHGSSPAPVGLHVAPWFGCVVADRSARRLRRWLAWPLEPAGQMPGQSVDEEA